MKTLIRLTLIVSILCIFLGAGYAQTDILEIKKAVVGLVDQTAADIAHDAQGTFEKINQGEHPYKNKDDETRYVFVFNESLTVVAIFNPDILGENYKGKPDAKGNLYTDEILNGAFTHITGWVHYHFAKPGDSGIHPKTTYYKLVDGSDGNPYIVCSGFYTDSF